MHVWHWRFQVHHVQSWTPGILTTQVGDPATCKTHLTPKTKLTWADEESWLSLDNVYRVSCKWVVVIEWLLISWLVICGILDFNARNGGDNTDLRSCKTFTVSSVANSDIQDSTGVLFLQIRSFLVILHKSESAHNFSVKCFLLLNQSSSRRSTTNPSLRKAGCFV